MSDTTPQVKAPKDRSPSYPFISLQVAVDRLIALDAMFGRHPAPASKVGLAWKMKPGSSQAAQTLAALKSFGFVDYTGASEDRAAVISEDGRTFLRAQQDSVKREVLMRAALKPKAIEKYWHLWGADRPPSAVCLDALVLKGGFTQSAADTFLRVYDATIAYAGLSDFDNLSGADGDAEEDDFPGARVEIGDLIQVEINGQYALAIPARVREIVTFEGKPWVYIDGSQAGIPMEQVRLKEKGVSTFAPPPPLPLAEEARPSVAIGWKEERLVDDSGDETLLSYKGEPSVERYEFIRDYLDFRITRLKKAGGTSGLNEAGKADA